MQILQSERPIHKIQLSTKRYDLQKCKLHRAATSIGQVINKQSMCCCCLKYTNKKQIDCNFSVDQLFYLGPNISVYFITVKIIIFILIVMLCTFGLPMIVINYIRNDCQNITTFQCSTLFIINFSFVNSLTSQCNIFIQTILTSIGMVCVLFIGVIGRTFVQKKKLKCKQNFSYQNDYSVFIRLEDNKFNQKSIVQYLQKWWNNQKLQSGQNLRHILSIFFPESSQQHIQQLITYKRSTLTVAIDNQIQSQLTFLDYPLIKKIIFCYNVQKFAQIRKNIENLQQIVKQMSQINEQRQLKKKQLQRLKQILEQISNLKAENKINSYLQLTNKCIVIFSFQPFAKYFAQKFNNSSYQQSCSKLTVQNINLKTVELAPTAQQIVWEYHHLLLSQHKLKHRFCSILVLILVITMIQGLITGLILYWRNYLLNTSSFLQSIFSPFLALILIFINSLAQHLIIWKSQLQKRPFKSQAYKSQLKQIVLMLFLSEGLGLGLIYYLTGVQCIWMSNGFIESVFYLIVFELCLHSIGKFVNLGFLIQTINDFQ